MMNILFRSRPSSDVRRYCSLPKLILSCCLVFILLSFIIGNSSLESLFECLFAHFDFYLLLLLETVV